MFYHLQSFARQLSDPVCFKISVQVHPEFCCCGDASHFLPEGWGRNYKLRCDLQTGRSFFSCCGFWQVQWLGGDWYLNRGKCHFVPLESRCWCRSLNWAVTESEPVKAEPREGSDPKGEMLRASVDWGSVRWDLTTSVRGEGVNPQHALLILSIYIDTDLIWFNIYEPTCPRFSI